MTDLRKAAEQAREALVAIRDRQVIAILPWTHEIAAGEYARMLDWDRTDARKALAALDAALAVPDADPTATRRAALEEAAEHLEAMAKATPLGHEDKTRGASTYNWLRTHAAAIRALAEKEPTDD